MQKTDGGVPVRIDLTCPVELWQFELPSEGYPACSLMLYNLSDRLVTSVEVTAVLKDQAEEQLQQQRFTMDFLMLYGIQ